MADEDPGDPPPHSRWVRNARPRWVQSRRCVPIHTARAAVGTIDPLRKPLLFINYSLATPSKRRWIPLWRTVFFLSHRFLLSLKASFKNARLATMPTLPSTCPREHEHIMTVAFQT